jgi:hypothetical protein
VIETNFCLGTRSSFVFLARHLNIIGGDAPPTPLLQLYYPTLSSFSSFPVLVPHVPGWSYLHIVGASGVGCVADIRQDYFYCPSYV